MQAQSVGIGSAPLNALRGLPVKCWWSPHFLDFLSYVPDNLCGRRILDLDLDLGYGSGCDSKAMIGLGWDVLPVDGSAKMCRIASAVTGCPARKMLFSEMDFHGEFAGIWVCVSLLHVLAKEGSFTRGLIS